MKIFTEGEESGVRARRRKSDAQLLRQFEHFRAAYDLHCDPKLVDKVVRIRMQSFLERLHTELDSRARAAA